MSLIFHASLDNNFNDVVGNVDGTPSNISWKSTRRGLKPELNGTDAKITFGNIGTIKTIALWAHLRSTTESILDLNGTQTIDIAAGTVRGNSWSTPTIYIDGATTASLSNLTGYHQIIITTATGIAASAVVAGLISASYGQIITDDIRGYDNELSSGEALALYNSTSSETGVQDAERSYQHDPAALLPTQPGEVMRIGGKLAGDAVNTISDRSGSGNDAAINGAMPADDNYFIGGRRFVQTNANFVDCGNGSTLDLTTSVGIMAIGSISTLGTPKSICRKNNAYALSISAGNQLAMNVYIGGSWKQIIGDTQLDSNVTYVMFGKYDSISEKISIYLNGVSDNTQVSQSGVISTNSNDVHIGYSGVGPPFEDYHNGILSYVGISQNEFNLLDFFNALAVLPVFELNFRDYPDNPGAVWLDNTLIPFSSGVVGSNGTFSVDGDQFICGEDASTCTFRNNFKLDGQEYVQVKIGGVWYSGTTSVTIGSVTVSIAQGSNKITIAADNGDVIDKIRIQFRETV